MRERERDRGREREGGVLSLLHSRAFVAPQKQEGRLDWPHCQSQLMHPMHSAGFYVGWGKYAFPEVKVVALHLKKAEARSSRRL